MSEQNISFLYIPQPERYNETAANMSNEATITQSSNGQKYTELMISVRKVDYQ